MKVLKEILEKQIVQYAGRKNVPLKEIRELVFKRALRDGHVTRMQCTTCNFHRWIGMDFWENHGIKTTRTRNAKLLTFPSAGQLELHGSSSSSEESSDSEEKSSESEEKPLTAEIVSESKKLKMPIDEEEPVTAEIVSESKKRKMPIDVEETDVSVKKRRLDTAEVITVSKPVVQKKARLVTGGKDGMKVIIDLSTDEPVTVGNASITYDICYSTFRVQATSSVTPVHVNSMTLMEMDIPMPFYNGDIIVVGTLMYRVEIN